MPCTNVGFYSSDWERFPDRTEVNFGATYRGPAASGGAGGYANYSFTSRTNSFSATGVSTTTEFIGQPTDSITNTTSTYSTSSSGTGVTTGSEDPTPITLEDSDDRGQYCSEIETYTETASNYYASSLTTETGTFTTCLRSFTQTTSNSTQPTSSISSETISATYTRPTYDFGNAYSPYTSSFTSIAETLDFSFGPVTTTGNGSYTGPIAESLTTSRGDNNIGISGQTESGEMAVNFTVGSVVGLLGTVSVTQSSIVSTSSVTNVTYPLSVGGNYTSSAVNSNLNSSFTTSANDRATIYTLNSNGGYVSITYQYLGQYIYTVPKDLPGGNSGTYGDSYAGIVLIEPALPYGFFGFGGSFDVVTKNIYEELSVASGGNTFASVDTSAITGDLVRASIGPVGGRVVVTGECGLPDDDSGRSLAWYSTDSSPAFDTSSLLLATYASTYTSMVDEVQQTLTSTAAASYSISCNKSISNKDDFVSLKNVIFNDYIGTDFAYFGYNDTITRDATAIFERGTYLVTVTNAAGNVSPLTLSMTDKQSRNIPDGENWAVVYSVTPDTDVAPLTYTGWAYGNDWKP